MKAREPGRRSGYPVGLAASLCLDEKRWHRSLCVVFPRIGSLPEACVRGINNSLGSLVSVSLAPVARRSDAVVAPIIGPWRSGEPRFSGLRWFGEFVTVRSSSLAGLARGVREQDPLAGMQRWQLICSPHSVGCPIHRCRYAANHLLRVVRAALLSGSGKRPGQLGHGSAPVLPHGDSLGTRSDGDGLSSVGQATPERQLFPEQQAAWHPFKKGRLWRCHDRLEHWNSWQWSTAMMKSSRRTRPDACLCSPSSTLRLLAVPTFQMRFQGIRQLFIEGFIERKRAFHSTAVTVAARPS